MSFSFANRTNLATALFFLMVAAVGLIGSASLPMGSAMQMGAGYVPCLLSVVLAVLGAGILVQAVTGPPERLGAWPLRPLVCVIAVPLLFGALIDTAGLPVTTVFCTIMAGLASNETRWLEALALALGLAVFTYALFVAALGLPMSLWPQW